jgi:N-acetylmuramoyl-L-alanine amidase CwlA
MSFIQKKLSIDEFRDYIKDYNFGRKIDKIVIHHTWKPRSADWEGHKTMLAVQGYYRNTKKWKSGPHLFIAPDGIWLSTPLNQSGIHAGWRGNPKSIGIEVVGDYDRKVWQGEIKKNAIAAMKLLMIKLGLDTQAIKFHNDYSSKSCPGYAITKAWIAKELNLYEEQDDVPDWKNVAGKMSARNIWSVAAKNKYISDKTKFDDPLTVGKFLIFMARIFPKLFK